MILLQQGGMQISNLILILLILVLVIYILYLQYQLRKKDLHLDSLHEEFGSSKESDGSGEARSLKSASSGLAGGDTISHDPVAALKKILDRETERSVIYLHYTSSRNIADKILNEGFKFSDSFHKTAEQISKDLNDLDYKHQIRKYFGNYIIVLAVGKEIFRYYEKELSLFDVQSLSIEHMLSQKLLDEETGDEIYLLPGNFVLGYYDVQSGEFIRNPGFDPGLDIKLPENNSSGTSNKG